MATPISETLVPTQRLMEKGKIRWCGASNLTGGLLEAAIEAAKARGGPRSRRWSRNTIWSIGARFEGCLAEICRREEIGVITYFQPGEGFSLGQIPQRRTTWTKSPRGGAVKSYLNPRGFRILDALEDITSRHKARGARSPSPGSSPGPA